MSCNTKKTCNVSITKFPLDNDIFQLVAMPTSAVDPATSAHAIAAAETDGK